MRQITETLARMVNFENETCRDGWIGDNSQSYNGPVVDSSDVKFASDATDIESKTPKKGRCKKKVSFELSAIRRYSLTGSLPDLAKTTDSGSRTCTSEDQLDIHIRREPLPMGSDTFRAVMGEIEYEVDDHSSDENVSDSLNHSWDGVSERRLGRSTQRFKSKAAAAIYSKVFVAPFPKSNEKRPKDHAEPQSPRICHRAVQSSAGRRSSPEQSLSSSTSSSRNTSSPSSPRQSVKQHQLTARHAPSLSTNSGYKLSPLVTGEIGHVRMSSEKVGICRQSSLPAESPRLLHRTKQHHNLTKSASLDC